MSGIKKKRHLMRVAKLVNLRTGSAPAYRRTK